MLIITKNAGQGGLAGFLLVMSGGLVISVFTTVVLSALPAKMVLAAFAAALLFVPSLFMKEAKQYWLAAYLLAVLFEGAGVNVAKYFTSDPLASPQWILTHLGAPAGALGLRVFPSDLILLGLILMWLSRIAARKESIYVPKISYLALAYLAWASASSLFKSPYFYLSVTELLRQYEYFLLYLYLANAVDSKRILKVAISALMAVLLVQGSLTVVRGQFDFIYKSITGVSFSEEGKFVAYEDAKSLIKRAQGTHGPQLTAYLLECLIQLTVALALINRRTRKKWLYLFLFALGMAGLFGAHSRAAMLGVTAGLMSVSWLALRRGFLVKRELVIWIYVVLLFSSAYGPKVILKVTTYLTARPTSYTGRFASFEQGQKLIAENPILGVGLNNSTAVKILFEDDKETISNQYLVVAAESGLVGLALYLGFFASVAAAALQLSKSRDRDIALIAIAVVGVYVSLGVHVFADPLVKIPTIMLWFYAGATMGLKKIEGSNTESRVRET